MDRKKLEARKAAAAAGGNEWGGWVGWNETRVPNFQYILGWL